ncbi:MAG: metallophosphoesterase [Clostridia bacterium]|nr:metallophosphoesterase [Clostridia bacterium]
MALYTIADLHLSESTDKPMDVFGKQWENHKERLEAAWRETVREEDTVVIPGDISWGMRFENTEKDLLFIHSLPGHKIIGKGNHDYWWGTLTKLYGFRDRIGATSIDFLFNNAYKTEGKVICGTRGWFPDGSYGPEDEKIVLREAGRLARSIEAGRALLEEGDELLVFLHYPPAFGGVKCAPLAEILWAEDVKRCYYGHLHGISNQLTEKSLGKTDLHLIAADALGFKPLLIE